MNFLETLSLVGAFIGMIALLVFTYYGSRWYARRISVSQGTGKYIKFCDRAAMGADASLVIAQVGERYYLLGVSEKNMQLICELSDFSPVEDEPRQRAASFGDVFSDMLRRIRRVEQNKDDGGDL